MQKLDFKKTAGFLTSALLTGAIYMGGLLLLQQVWHLNPYLSVSIAYTAAMVFYFVTNKFLVFKKPKTQGGLAKEVGQFAIVCVINYGITLLLVWGIKSFTGEVYSGSIVAGIVTTILAYLVFDKMFA